MLRLIFKNLWSRRRNNVLLFIELIIITYVAWIIVDNITVMTYDRYSDSGIDEDRLCQITIGSLMPDSPDYKPDQTSDRARTDAYRRMLDRVKEMPEVENATFAVLAQGINMPGCCTSSISNANETYYSTLCCFVTGTNFFETYGIKSGSPSRPVEELSNEPSVRNSVIVTQWFADKLSEADSLDRDLKGVVGNVKMYYPLRSHNTVFIPINPDGYILSIVIRLREGVNPADFAYDNRDFILTNIRSGNLFARSITDYDTVIKEHYYTLNSNNTFNRYLIVLIFFIICLFLGVIGSYYLQTRQRSNEAGIMKSYGASRGYIIRLMTGEAVTLTVISWIAGTLLYLNFPFSDGLATGVSYLGGTVVQPTWVDNYAVHAAIIAALVLVIMIIPTIIGVIIPSWKVSRVNPVDALRDE